MRDTLGGAKEGEDYSWEQMEELIRLRQEEEEERLSEVYEAPCNNGEYEDDYSEESSP